MKILLSLFLSVIFCSSVKESRIDMGMYYYLIPETLTDCSDDFPTVLSYFFEQVGGYGEYAAISQLEKELDIDLSIFQNTLMDEYDFKEMEEYGEIKNAKKEFKEHKEKTKIKTELLLALLTDFKYKLSESRNFADKIKFNDNLNLPTKTRYLCPPKLNTITMVNLLAT